MKKYPRQITLSDDDLALAQRIANAQHLNSGRRGTRGAGSNLDYRRRGVLGEIAVARMLGIEPQVRALSGPDSAPDIVLNDGTVIEVKCGLPLEAKTKLRPGAIYVCVEGWDRHFRVSACMRAEDMIGRVPPYGYITRAGTEDLNWWFGPDEA